MVLTFSGTINEATKYAYGIGYVYPFGEETYYVNSGLTMNYLIRCNDGEFFCSEIEDENPFKQGINPTLIEDKDEEENLLEDDDY